MGNRSLDEDSLTTVFDTFWPLLEDSIRSSLSKYPSKKTEGPVRQDSDLLHEILMSVRELSQRQTLLEQYSADYRTIHLRKRRPDSVGGGGVSQESEERAWVKKMLETGADPAKLLILAKKKNMSNETLVDIAAIINTKRHDK